MMDFDEERTFMGYRFRMQVNDNLIHWTPLDEHMPDVVLLALQRTLNAIAEQARLNLERPQPPEKFWVAEFDKRIKRIADGWIKSR